MERIEARLADLQESDRPEDPSDVREAMFRLRHAVVSHLRARKGDANTRRAVTDILTEAQERIAKLGDTEK